MNNTRIHNRNCNSNHILFCSKSSIDNRFNNSYTLIEKMLKTDTIFNIKLD